MKRRSVLAWLGFGLTQIFTTSPAYSMLQRAKNKARIPASEYEPFRKIAKAKGVKIYVNEAPPFTTASALDTIKTLHLDMNMVRASIENAIERTKKETAINEKLRRLLANGTAVQQVDFVHGTGRYYFPEDVETAITQSEATVKSADDVQCWVCKQVCSIVCSCLENSDQVCKEKCREVCSKYC